LVFGRGKKFEKTPQTPGAGGEVFQSKIRALIFKEDRKHPYRGKSTGPQTSGCPHLTVGKKDYE